MIERSKLRSKDGCSLFPVIMIQRCEANVIRPLLFEGSGLWMSTPLLFLVTLNGKTGHLHFCASGVEAAVWEDKLGEDGKFSSQMERTSLNDNKIWGEKVRAQLVYKWMFLFVSLALLLLQSQVTQSLFRTHQMSRLLRFAPIWDNCLFSHSSGKMLVCTVHF